MRDEEFHDHPLEIKETEAEEAKFDPLKKKAEKLEQEIKAVIEEDTELESEEEELKWE